MLLAIFAVLGVFARNSTLECERLISRKDAKYRQARKDRLA